MIAAGVRQTSLDPNSPVAKAIGREAAELFAAVDERIARDQAAERLRETG